ncbi:unnamed protein product, partial [Polarella glacialis]
TTTGFIWFKWAKSYYDYIPTTSTTTLPSSTTSSPTSSSSSSTTSLPSVSSTTSTTSLTYMNGGDQRGQGQSYGGGLPLSEFNKLVPPGWRPGIPGYPIKLFFERLKLWYRVTDNAEAQLGILVAGRLQGAPQKIALRLRLPRPVAAGGGYDIGDEALIRLSQEQVIDPATNTIVQEYIPSGLQFLCQALRAIYGLQDQDRTTVALDSFYEFKRGHLGLAEFAQEFDHRYESAEEEAGLQMNDTGKTYFFLRGSGLGDKIIEDIKLQMRGDMSRYQEIRTLVLKLARANDKDKETLNMYQDQTDFNYKLNLDIIEYDYGANTSDDMYYGDYDYVYDGEYSDYDGAGYDDDWYGDDGWQEEVYHGDFPLEEWTWPGQTKGKGKGFGSKGKGPSGGSASGIGCATCGSRWRSSLDCPLNDPSKGDQGKGKGGKDYHYENFWKGKGKGKKGGKSKGFGKGWSKGFGKYRPSFGSGKGYGNSPYNFTAFQDNEVQEALEHAPTIAFKADGSGTQYYDFDDEKPSSSTRPPPQSTTEPMIDTAGNLGYNDGYGELDTAPAPMPDVRVNSLSLLVGTCSSAFPTDHEDWSSLYHSVRGVKRHGLLIDPGAASGLIGSDTLKEFRDEILLPLGVDIICRPTTQNVSGISGKPEPALSRVTMPIFPGIKSSTFTADVIGKQGSKCPALLPNPSMRAANMGLLTNFFENGDGMLIVHDNGKRLLYRCLLTESGHYILPTDSVKNNNNVGEKATRKASAFYAAVLHDATQQWSDISAVYLAVDKADDVPSRSLREGSDGRLAARAAGAAEAKLSAGQFKLEDKWGTAIATLSVQGPPDLLTVIAKELQDKRLTNKTDLCVRGCAQMTDNCCVTLYAGKVSITSDFLVQSAVAWKGYGSSDPAAVSAVLPVVSRVVVQFASERYFDQDLALYSRALPLTAEEHEQLNANLVKRGIFKKAQLAGIDPTDLTEGLAEGGGKKTVEARLEASKSAETTAIDAKEQKAEAGNKAMDQMLEKQKEQASQLKERMDKVLADMVAATKTDSAELKAQIKGEVQDVKDTLGKMTVSAADLDTSAASGQLDKMSSSGGFVNGQALTMKQLLNFMGLFRGVTLTANGMSRSHQTVVELNPNMAAKDDLELRLKVQTVPDMEAKEETVTMDTASDVQLLDGWVEVLGASAVSSASNSKSLSLGFAPAKTSAGFTSSTARSNGEATGFDKDSKQVDSKNTKTLTKTSYFFEPKLQIDVTNLMLTSTSDFSSRTRQISYDLCQAKGQGGCGRKPETATATATPVVADEVKPEVVGSVDISFVVENMRYDVLLTQSALALGVEDTVKRMIIAQLPATKVRPIVKVTLSKPKPASANPSQDTLIVATLNASISVIQHLQDKKIALSQSLGANLPHVLHIEKSQVKNQTSNEAFALKVLGLEVIKQQVALLDTSSSRLSGAGGEPTIGEPSIGETIDTLIYDFGTHVCPHVVLGGWWSRRAKFESLENTRRIDVDRITSEAIRNAASDSTGFAVSGQVKGVVASASNEDMAASAGDNTKTKGTKDISQAANKNWTIEITQTWKGGASGTSPADWRKSLDSSLSSNWKTIDRKLEMCEGIWTFVQNKELKWLLCKNWIGKFLASLEFHPGQINQTVTQQACANTMGMRALIDWAKGTSAGKKDELLEKERSACNSKNESFWDDRGKICSIKQCLCSSLTTHTDIPGTRGAECPEHDARDCIGCCKPEQRATCSSFKKGCQKGGTYMLLDPQQLNERCQGGTCSVSPLSSVELCCYDMRDIASFQVQVKMTEPSTAFLFASFDGPHFHKSLIKGQQISINMGDSKFLAGVTKTFPLFGPVKNNELCLAWKSEVLSGSFYIDVVTLRDDTGKIKLAEMRGWPTLGSAKNFFCKQISWITNENI